MGKLFRGQIPVADFKMVCAEIVTTRKQNLLAVFCYRSSHIDLNWVMKFHNFLDLTSDLYNNMHDNF